MLAAALTMAAAPALAQVGSAAMPIVLKMERGTDAVVVHGRLRQNAVDACCTYVFKAHAGQKLYWTERGAAVRMVITYPDGTSDGPGLPNPLPLPADGAYTLAVSPDLMADGGFGPFTMTLRIPPAR
jgi:hypothetical protein